jgi:hypothetical protein
MPFQPFLCAPNLIVKNLTEGNPWDFSPSEAKLAAARKMPKEKRREWTLKDTTDWHCYSSVRGVISNQRIGGDNPAAGLRGLVADFDMKSNIDQVQHYLSQIKNTYVPNFVEISLSEKIRLVWIFEREQLVPSSKFCEALVTKMFDKMGVPTLLPGFDAKSVAATEMWTNGGVWYETSPTPMPRDLVLGFAIDASKKIDFGNAEVPLEIIAEEIQKRFPDRWKGDFALNALGVRFWDPLADNETGAQVKPDGMLCFTGTQSFVKWAEIFGADWVNEQRALNLGNAAGEICFDGRTYWDFQNGVWNDIHREDVVLALKNKGVSARAGKGQAASDVDKVLWHIQTVNRVAGALPLVNYKPGLLTLDGQRVLNTSTLRALQPADVDAKPEVHFPFIWKFINGLFDNVDLGSVDHFLAWLQRFYLGQLNYERKMGQAVFLCGPRGNGKTLLCLRIIKPLVGDRIANPYDYFTGATTFNDELFETPLLAINDEEAPERDSVKRKFLARIKAFVVNPSHKYHPKFCKRLTIEWCGRIFATLNDDPNSVGLLPERNSNTEDKICFFGSRPYAGEWLDGPELEATIKRELPFFAAWLKTGYTPPKAVLIKHRTGVASFFDPRILKLSREQDYAYHLLELLRKWAVDGSEASEWKREGDDLIWTGTPSDLMTSVNACDHLEILVRDWSVSGLYRSLTTLARVSDTGVYSIDESERMFRFNKNQLLQKENDNDTVYA